MLMMSKSNRAWLRCYGTLLARIFVGGLFLYSGIVKLVDGAAGTAGVVESVGLPAPLLFAWLAILIEIVAGAMIILGYRFGLAAGVLILYILLLILFVHLDLGDMNLFKNLAIIGGLLYMMAYGPGEGWSLGGAQSKPEPAAGNPGGMGGMPSGTPGGV